MTQQPYQWRGCLHYHGWCEASPCKRAIYGSTLHYSLIVTPAVAARLHPQTHGNPNVIIVTRYCYASPSDKAVQYGNAVQAHLQGIHRGSMWGCLAACGRFKQHHQPPVAGSDCSTGMHIPHNLGERGEEQGARGGGGWRRGGVAPEAIHCRAQVATSPSGWKTGRMILLMLLE